MKSNSTFTRRNDAFFMRLLSEGRIYFIGAILVLLLLLVLGHLFVVQVLRHDMYIERANNQYIKRKVVTNERGAIYFSNRGHEKVPAATMLMRYTVAVNPKEMKNKEATLDALRVIFPRIDYQQAKNRINKQNDAYEELVFDVTEEEKDILEAAKLRSVYAVSAPVRVYPQNEIAAKTIGYVGYSGDEWSGIYGVERLFNNVLSRSTDDLQMNFFAQVFNDKQMPSFSEQEREEGNLMLTLDIETSRKLRQVLIDTQQKWKSDVVGGIIMNPETGAIYAMDVIPTFNPNDYKNASSVSLFSNELVSGVYEMGSIIKPLTVAAAVDAGLVNAQSTYMDTGSRMLNTFTVRNYDSKARGLTTVQSILDKSLNVGIVHLVEILGVTRFQTYFKKFGLGRETGIDVPGEANGLTANLDSDIFVDSATAGFGQGLAITPMQTIRALAVLANEGHLVTPHVVDSVVYTSGETKKYEWPTDQQVISSSSAKQVTDMLVHVVDTALKGGDYKMDRYSVAAKTGTAQLPKRGGGYLEGEYLHSFFGYFPAKNPKFIIFLFQRKPQGAEYASATLTDPFYDLVNFLLSHFEIPPDR